MPACICTRTSLFYTWEGRLYGGTANSPDCHRTCKSAGYVCPPAHAYASMYVRGNLITSASSIALVHARARACG